MRQRPFARLFCATIVLSLAVVGLEAAPTRAADKLVFKMSTLAPQGSPWLDRWARVVEDVEAQSPMPHKIKTYGGGVMGDEPDLVRKLKFDQLQIVGVTVSGIAKLMPEILVLNQPFLFNSYDEVDHVVDKLFPRFQELAAERDLYLIAMLDQGMVELFSKNRAASPEAYFNQKLWVWNADPVGIQTAETFDANSVMLPVPEVLPSLQTGLANALFTSSTALVSLQWHTQMRYYYPVRLRYDPAAIIMSRKALRKIPEDKLDAYKEMIKNVTDKHMSEFKSELRANEREMRKRLVEDTGLEKVTWSEGDVAAMRARGERIREELAGDLYPQSLLDEVTSALETYRREQQASGE